VTVNGRIGLFAEWPQAPVGMTPEEHAVAITHTNVDLRRWLAASFGGRPAVEVVLWEHIQAGSEHLADHLRPLNALVILREGSRPIAGEVSLIEAWQRCGSGRAVLLRPQLGRVVRNGR